jgi:N-acetylneuraminate synthase/N,N'-diacetyllegionaminate synthase
MKSVKIRHKEIGHSQPCFIIAEAGVNHNGSIELAKELVDVAVFAGVDAIKFQTFKAEKVVHDRAPKAEYQINTNENNESQLEMVKRLELSFSEFEEIYRYCQSRGIIFLSSPFDEESADFLDNLGVSAFKLGSGEITNMPFLIHIARKRKPIILSTGMSTLDEVREAVQTIRLNGNPDLIILHCVSNYPADVADSNLMAMKAMADEFSVPIGWSDHTIGNVASIVSVALGATVLERHFTLDKNLPGPDHKASLDPEELTIWVNEIRQAQTSLGSGLKEPTASEIEMARIARKSLHVQYDLKRGHILTRDDLIALRPGTGILPNRLEDVCGKILVVDLPAGTLLLGEHFE